MCPRDIREKSTEECPRQVLSRTLNAVDLRERRFRGFLCNESGVCTQLCHKALHILLRTKCTRADLLQHEASKKLPSCEVQNVRSKLCKIKPKKLLVHPSTNSHVELLRYNTKIDRLVCARPARRTISANSILLLYCMVVWGDGGVNVRFNVLIRIRNFVISIK